MERSVYPDNLRNAGMDMESITRSLHVSSSKTREIISSLSRSSESYVTVSGALKRYETNLERLSARIDAFAGAASRIAGIYEDTDIGLAEGRKTASNALDKRGKKTKSKTKGLFEEREGSWKTGKEHYSLGPIAGSVSGAVLKRKAKLSLKTKADLKKGELSTELSGKASVSALHGKVSARTRLSMTEAEISVGKVAATGAVGITLMKGGKLDPSVNAKVSAEATVVEGKIKKRVGSKDFNVHTKAEGKVLTASAEAGVDLSKEGLKASASAEAYLAKGSVSKGITLFGIKLDATVEGKAGGAGIGGMAEVGGEKASGYIGAGLGLGVGLKLEIDWSGFKGWNPFK